MNAISNRIKIKNRRPKFIIYVESLKFDLNLSTMKELFKFKNTILSQLTLGYACFTPVRSDDLFMYLELGKKVFAGEFLNFDPFLIQAPSPNWHIAHEWGSYLLFYSIFWLGGFNFVIAFKTLLISLMSFLLVWTLIKNKNYLAGPLLLIGAYAGCLRFSEKASLISDFFCVLLIFVMTQKNKSQKMFLFGVPALFLIWVNCHPGFPLGLFLLGLLVLTQKPRILFVKSFFISVLACMINPLGIKGFLYPFEKIWGGEWMIFRTHFLEWMPTFSPGAFAVPEVLCLVAIWALTAFLLIKNKSIFETVVFIFLVLLGHNALRFMFVSALGCLILISQNLKPIKSIRFLSLGFQMAALVLVIGWGYPTHTGFIEAGGGVSPYALPIGAADFIESNHWSGNLFNETDWGSYFVWRFDGALKVAYHGHIDCPKFLDEVYMKIYRSDIEVQSLIEQMNIKMFVLRKRVLAKGHPMEIRYLSRAVQQGEWVIAYYDDLSVILKRRE